MHHAQNIILFNNDFPMMQQFKLTVVKQYTDSITSEVNSS